LDVAPSRVGTWSQRLREPRRGAWAGQDPLSCCAGWSANGPVAACVWITGRSGPSSIAPTARSKKTACAEEQDRPDPRRLVFIEEPWAKTNMATLRRWAPRGDRPIGRGPHGHWQATTFIAALRHDRIDAPFVLDGPLNGGAFRAHVEQTLVPTLQPGDVVVMDNLGSRKGRAVRASIRAD